jgi:hypothetical protein
MKINEVIWFDEVIEKLLRKHNIRQSEVMEVFTGRPHFRHGEKGFRPGEDVYAAMGRTGGGRYMTVFFVYKAGGRALIITARDMTGAERRLYGKA